MQQSDTSRQQTRQYPASIRHRKAFEAWYAAGRKVNAEVLATAKIKQRETIYTWRAAEGWETFADLLDSQATGVIAEATTDRIAIVQDAKEKHIEDMKALLQAGRAACAEMIKRLMRRMAAGADVDMSELAQWASSLGLIDRVGASIFKTDQPLQVQHSINPQMIEALKQRLTPMLEAAEKKGISFVDIGIA
jgi:hypothetical protein